MTTPRIEEWESVTWNVLSSVQTGRMSLADAQDKLDAVLHHQLQKAHQAGIDEVVEKMQGMKKDINERDLEVGYMDELIKESYNQALDDTIKALQDNK